MELTESKINFAFIWNESGLKKKHGQGGIKNLLSGINFMLEDRMNLDRRMS
jgi:hypothetical protein